MIDRLCILYIYYIKISYLCISVERSDVTKPSWLTMGVAALLAVTLVIKLTVLRQTLKKVFIKVL